MKLHGQLPGSKGTVIAFCVIGSHPCDEFRLVPVKYINDDFHYDKDSASTIVVCQKCKVQGEPV